MSIVSGTLGAVMGSNAQDNATEANNRNSAAALAQQKQMYDEQIAREKPFYDTGVKANSSLDKMVNGGYDMKESPAAQYELTQGTKSLNRQLAARGLLGSGNAAERLSELSSGVAAKDYQDQYARLLDQVKIGTGASASAGAASNTMSQNIGNASAMQQQNNTMGAQARASLYSGMGGASAQAANVGINAYRSGLFSSGAGSGAAAGTAGDGALSDTAAMVI
jgi:hypothetical protein